MDLSDPILTVEQVAEMLQIHHFTVLKYIKSGRLKAAQLGRVYRVRQSDVEAFLEQSTYSPSPRHKSSRPRRTHRPAVLPQGK